jgi:hypothetical protein
VQSTNVSGVRQRLHDSPCSHLVELFERGDCSYVDAALALAQLPGRAPLNRRALVCVNGALRQLDQSHLLPINDAFNATDRAIRRVARCRDACEDVVSYVAAVERELDRIVNT